MKSKYFWYTDTHLDKVMPWKKYSFIKFLEKENPTGIILTGDISNGLKLEDDLSLIAEAVSCPIYMVVGNHDYHGSSIEKTHDKIRNLCSKYANLIWLTEAGVIHINDEVAFIGTEGWYDAENGNPDYLRFTLDWFLIDDFRKLPNMDARIKAWRKLAEESGAHITKLLEKALEQKYKTIYIWTHFPPWKEATRDIGTFMEKFWLPYNCNVHLGRAIEKVMENHKKKNVFVGCGHTHTDCWIHINRSIECKVNAAKYYNFIRNEEIIYI
jgi:3',5'-cyclic-AMP phosphodiesterase